jgi:hypothetical protein
LGGPPPGRNRRRVALSAGDIDLLVARREDVDAFAAALSRFSCLYAPSWLPDARQDFAGYDVNGAAVEISTVEAQAESDGLECIGRGPWEHYVRIACGAHRVPAVRLELRLATELLRERADRYRPLLTHMRAHGYDPGLMQRAMRAHHLPPERQRQVLTLLSGPPVDWRTLYS